MKNRRQKKIRELIREFPIGTQEELALFLRQSGIDVTQATVSRDIRELGLVKISDREDVYRYALPAEGRKPVGEERMRFIISEFVISIDYSENLVVLKTDPGNAQSVAFILDQAGWKEIIGTVAGDDTILLVIKPVEMTGKIVEKIESYL